MDHALIDRHQTPGAPRVRRVEASRPVVWLERGWADLKKAWAPSLLYGAWAAAFGFALLLVASRTAYLVPALIGGFLLVAPFVAIVFYALSEQIEQGRRVDGAEAVFAWRRNTGSIAAWGLVLAMSLLFWERLAAIIFAMFFSGDIGRLDTLLTEILFSGRYIPLLVVYFGVGGLFALTVYAFGIVTAPMLLDRDVDVITAALTSLKCCLVNPGAALVWAMLLFVLTSIGFVTLMLGLVVVFPLLGHASWHAYRDMVE